MSSIAPPHAFSSIYSFFSSSNSAAFALCNVIRFAFSSKKGVESESFATSHFFIHSPMNNKS